MPFGPECKTTIEWATALCWQKRKWSNLPQWCLRPNSVYGTCIGRDSTGCLLKSWTFPSLIKLIHGPNKQCRGSRCGCWRESWVWLHPSPWAAELRPISHDFSRGPAVGPRAAHLLPHLNDLFTITHTCGYREIDRYCGHMGPHTLKYSQGRGSKLLPKGHLSNEVKLVTCSFINF